ncbi:hypothetical protein HNV11_14000 [Spirosoma taeanense]|uniref:DUF3575 domain-containing protein n=1 Tax=Spirosoma taeanense TaxID=2735870 RepID=A0A6M5YBZ5_9BACT|nr:hypothetical protein [Spirosoma taeanense]QJW90412.1 hypothetical protein HNV11_14000 [Spirosoma taeanense]
MSLFSVYRIPLACAGLLIGLAGAEAQDATRLWSRPNLLKTNLLAPVSLFYERALSRRSAIRFSSRWLKLPQGYGEDKAFVNATLEGKIYTASLTRLAAKAHPTGIFINPYLKARSMQYVQRVGYGTNKTGDLDEIKVNSIGLGLTIGYQWVSRRGFVIELFNGAGAFPIQDVQHTLRYGTVIADVGDYLNLDIRSGISLGYAF